MSDSDDRMAFAFTPPAHIREHAELNALFTEIVDRMKREAEGIPLETNQHLIISKIALEFVEMKYRDDTQSWIGTNARKDANAQWIALMAEWRVILKDNKEKISEKAINDFIAVISEVAGKIPDDDIRRNTLREMKEQLAARGY